MACQRFPIRRQNPFTIQNDSRQLHVGLALTIVGQGILYLKKDGFVATRLLRNMLFISSQS